MAKKSAKLSENCAETQKKQRGRPFVKNDPRRVQPTNGGRPKNTDSVTYWMAQFKQATPAENADKCKHFEQAFKSYGNTTMPCAAIIAAGQVVTAMSDAESKCVDRSIASDPEQEEKGDGNVVVTLNLGEWKG